MHANDREDIAEAGPGDIVALVGVDCASGDTLCGEELNYSLESIFVADPVISLAVTPASSADQDRMAKALNRFMKEDPTFRVSTDPETGETIIAGMGELHLDIYIERMRREYKANVTVGAPNVSYREAPTVEAEFDYRHKKQTGGSGQFAHVVGRLIPLPDGAERPYEFEDNVTRRAHPARVHPGRQQGLRGGHEERARWPATRSSAARCAWTTARTTTVDSSEMAFRIAAIEAFKQAFRAVQARACMEPIMKVEVETPLEFQGPIVGDLNSRRGMILEHREPRAPSPSSGPRCRWPTCSATPRSSAACSKGMATFTMEMSRYARVPTRLAEEIITQRREKQAAGK